jgi:hypothetical protein
MEALRQVRLVGVQRIGCELVGEHGHKHRESHDGEPDHCRDVLQEAPDDEHQSCSATRGSTRPWIRSTTMLTIA